MIAKKTYYSNFLSKKNFNFCSTFFLFSHWRVICSKAIEIFSVETFSGTKIRFLPFFTWSMKLKNSLVVVPPCYWMKISNFKLVLFHSLLFQRWKKLKIIVSRFFENWCLENLYEKIVICFETSARKAQQIEAWDFPIIQSLNFKIVHQEFQNLLWNWIFIT